MEDRNKIESDKKNKLLIALVSVMSLITVTTLSVLGIILYKDYISNNDSVLNTETKIDNNTMLMIDGEGNGQLVDVSYYGSVEKYINKFIKYSETVYPIVSRNVMTDTYRERVNNHTNDFIIYSKEFAATPTANEDYILESSFIDFKISAEMFADYMKDYAYKNDTTYLSFIRNSLNDTKIHLDTIAQIEEKYYK